MSNWQTRELSVLYASQRFPVIASSKEAVIFLIDCTYKNDADVPIPISSTASDISIYSSVLFIREPLSLGLRQFGIRLVNCSVAHRLKKIRLSEPQVTKNHE